MENPDGSSVEVPRFSEGGTHADCFYDDKKIINFIRFLNGENHER